MGYRDNIKNYIPIKECIHGALYRIAARNFVYAVYNKDDNGFYGIRQKFNDRYVFPEHHWDLGVDGWGTAKPLQLIEAKDVKIDDDIIFKYLDNFKKSLDF